MNRPTPTILPLSLALIALPGAALAEPDTISLERAIEVALDENPELAMSDATVDAADARVASARARRYPSVRAEGNVFVWDDELSFELPPAPMQPPDADSSVTVRARVTGQATLTVAQPISTLIPINRLVEVEEHGAGAARAEHDATRLDVAARVARTYLRALQAGSASEIAEASVRQVEAQLERARTLREVGSLEKVDVMRLEAALAAARQEELEADTARRLAVDALVLAIGLPPGTELRTVDTFGDRVPPLPWTPAGAAESATTGRPALTAAAERAAQADRGRELAKTHLYPNIIGVANYQRTEGQGTFARKNAWFAGITLEWNVWDWKSTWNEVEEAGAEARRARIGHDLLRDQLTLQARSRALEARTAREAVKVATAGLEAAEEAFRIQSVRYSEGAATTTDLLQSETEVTRARLRHTAARYGYLTALVELARAMGRLPAEVLTRS